MWDATPFTQYTFREWCVAILVMGYTYPDLAVESLDAPVVLPAGSTVKALNQPATSFAHGASRL